MPPSSGSIVGYLYANVHGVTHHNSGMFVNMAVRTSIPRYSMPLCRHNNKHIIMHGRRQWLCNGPNDQAIIAPLLSFTNSTNRFWVTPSLLVNAQWGNSGRNVQVITRLSTVEVKKECIYTFYTPIRGYTVAQLVEALRYKQEGRGFVSRLCHFNFSLT